MPDSASKFYQEIASRATQENQKALMHAVLSIASQHLVGLQRKSGDLPRAAKYAAESVRHRQLALRTLRQVPVVEEEIETHLAVLLMLVLSAILKGDADIVAHYLSRGEALLARLRDPSPRSLLPTLSALHGLYSVFYAVAQGRQLDPAGLFRDYTASRTWAERADNTVETLAGIVSFHRR